MGRHSSRGTSWTRRQVLAASALASAASWTAGIFLIVHANQLGAANYDYNGQPLDVLGVFCILLPFIGVAAWIAVRLVRAAAAEHRRYQAWKASLPPGQRAAVEAGEAVALAAAALAWHEHNKRTSARLTSSVMGRTMPDGRTPRLTQQLPPRRD